MKYTNEEQLEIDRYCRIERRMATAGNFGIVRSPYPSAWKRAKEIELRGWHTGTPDIPPGTQTRFWVATRNDDGKVFERLLVYGNQYRMPLGDDQDEPPSIAMPIENDEEYLWTGWWQESCESCETSWCFSGEIVAWMNLPSYPMNPNAPATYLGIQDFGEGLPKLTLWNLTADIPDHPAGSSVSSETLIAAGYDLPEQPKEKTP
jgi:hypothetical protein